MQELTAANVQNVFFDCLFTEDEVKDLSPGQAPDDSVLVRGVTINAGLNKTRLAKHKDEIKELLSQLHDTFFYNQGGGMSFLKLPFLKDESQWGEHESAQQLMLLGIASGFMKYCVPESVWAALPGGVPYVVINLDGFDRPE